MIGGISLFPNATESLGTLSVPPLNFFNYVFINTCIALLIGVLEFYLIANRVVAIRRMNGEVCEIEGPATSGQIEGGQVAEGPVEVNKPIPGLAIIDDKRVPAATNFPPIVIPIQEQKRRRLEELQERHDHVFEVEKARYEQELQAKKQEILDEQRKKKEKATKRTKEYKKEYKKIKGEIELQKELASARTAPEKPKPREKPKDEFDFT
jgi:hypothetical protein